MFASALRNTVRKAARRTAASARFSTRPEMPKMMAPDWPFPELSDEAKEAIRTGKMTSWEAGEQAYLGGTPPTLEELKTKSGMTESEIAEKEAEILAFEALPISNEGELWFREQAKKQGLDAGDVDDVCKHVAQVRLERRAIAPRDRRSFYVQPQTEASEEFRACVKAMFGGQVPSNPGVMESFFEAGNQPAIGLDDEGFGTLVYEDLEVKGRLSDDPNDWTEPSDIPVHHDSNTEFTVVKMKGEKVYIPPIARTLEWALETPTEQHLFDETPVIYEATSWPVEYDEVESH